MGTEDTATTGQGGVTKQRGSCHCGALRFEVAVDLGRGASRCNCSVCQKIAAVSVIVKPEALRVLSDLASVASTYAWAGRTGTRYFCKHCGVHTFLYGNLPELGGDYVSVNVNTLDDIDPNLLPLVHWDGRHNNWEAGPRPTPWPIMA